MKGSEAGQKINWLHPEDSYLMDFFAERTGTVSLTQVGHKNSRQLNIFICICLVFREICLKLYQSQHKKSKFHKYHIFRTYKERLNLFTRSFNYKQIYEVSVAHFVHLLPTTNFSIYLSSLLWIWLHPTVWKCLLNI